MERIVVLSGAGMSAESGLRTFRDADGLWEGHDVMEVASPEGWMRNRDLVLDFYNQRRRQLLEVEPNAGHLALKKLEANYDVKIITQNVDDLHERAESSQVLHLHGELLKARSTGDPHHIVDWRKDIGRADVCPSGFQMRPHIVWFGEPVPAMEIATEQISTASIVIIVGTSLQVYPAAGLIGYAPPFAQVIYIDPRPAENFELRNQMNVRVIADTAANALPDLVEEILTA